MSSISQNQRYLPHELNTKFHAVKLYRNGYSVSFVCRRYKISKSSLMRWNKKFDGTKESLLDKSHKPHSKHPNAHTEQELKWINDYLRRNPNITMPELYGKLRTEKGYSRHACFLFRVLRKLGHFKNKEIHKNILLNLMTLLKISVLNGKWMLNMFLKNVILVLITKSFTNIPS